MIHFCIGERIKMLCLSIPAMATSPQVAYRAGELLFSAFGARRSRQSINFLHSLRAIVVKLDEIGDLVLISPFLRELRRNMPTAWITLVVKAEITNLVDHCPYVNEVLTYDARTRIRPHKLRRHWRALSVAWKHLWRRRFDLAILPRWDTDHYHAAFLLYFSGAPVRVGYSENVNDRKRSLNTGYDRLFTHLIHDATPKHEVEHNLDVIRFLGGTVEDDRLELWLRQEDHDFAEEVFRAHAVRPGDVIVGFGPSGGNSPLKQWPISSFVGLGRWLWVEHQVRVLTVGGPGEELLGTEIERGVGPRTINMIGKTTLCQMAALLGRCDLYVGNDAGPMHIGAAMGTPVLALFGSSCPHRFGPWGSAHRILWKGLPCSPCLHAHHRDRCGECIFDRPHCLLEITEEEVQRAVGEMLQNRLSALPGDPHAGM